MMTSFARVMLLIVLTRKLWWKLLRKLGSKCNHRLRFGFISFHTSCPLNKKYTCCACTHLFRVAMVLEWSSIGMIFYSDSFFNLHRLWKIQPWWLLKKLLFVLQRAFSNGSIQDDNRRSPSMLVSASSVDLSAYLFETDETNIWWACSVPIK